MNKLSRDFVDVENRAKKIATSAVVKGVAAVTLFAAILTVGAQVLPYYLGGIEEAKRNDAVLTLQVKTLEERIKTLEENRGPKTDSVKRTQPKPTSTKAPK